MYQLTVKPTWQTVVMRKGLKGRPNDFQIELMDGTFKELLDCSDLKAANMFCMFIKSVLMDTQIHGVNQPSPKCTSSERLLISRSLLLISQLTENCTSIAAMLHQPVALNHPSNISLLTILGEYCRLLIFGVLI